MAATNAAAFLRVVLAIALATAGCGQSIACVKADGVRTTARCVEDNLELGDEISVRMSDGTRHDGHFIEILDDPDSLALVMSEYRRRSGREPVKIYLNMAAVDSVYEGPGIAVPAPLRPLMTLVGIAAIGVGILALIFMLDPPEFGS